MGSASKPPPPETVRKARSRGGQNFAWALLLLVAGAVASAGLWTTIEPSTQHDPGVARLLPPGSKRILVETVDGPLVATSAERAGAFWRLDRDGNEHLVAVDRITRIEPLTFRWGTDQLGRDVLARTLHGGRISLLSALLAVLLASLLGVGVGALAGMRGGWTDEVAMRVCDGLLGFPRLILLLAIAAATTPTAWTLVLVLALTSWMATARLVRAEVAGLSHREFVVAARAAGASPVRTFVAHILPHLKPTLAVDATLRFGELILLEASLSYLGLGIPPPAPSWGSMISGGQAHLVRAWWISFFPGVALVLTVLALTLLSDGYARRARAVRSPLA